MKYKATVMDEGAVMRALKRIAHEIVEKNGGCENLCVIGIKRRGVSLAKIIAENIAQIEGIMPEFAELDIKLYRDDQTKFYENPVVVNPDEVKMDVTGKNVVLVDDVIYTGRTVRAALDALTQMGRADRIMLAALIDRGHRELPIKGDFVGKNVPTSRHEHISVKIPPFDETVSVELYE